MVLVSGLPGAAQVQPGGTFVDDDGSVHEASIEALVTAGITTGCSRSGDRFCPDDPVSRGQMAAFLHRALPLGTGSATFEDTEGTVFAADVSSVADAGITFGCDPPDNTRFCPDATVTRGQMAALLVRGFDLPPADGAGSSFTDTAESEFVDDIDRLADAGLTLGCDPPGYARFCPDDVVTRGQMATFLVRALGLDAPEVPMRAATLHVVSREEWGAAEPQGPFVTHTPERLTIHHSGPPMSSTTGPPVFRSWQAYHFSLGWPDLAYHYIVGRDGLVYAARPETAVGDTATEYDPTGHFLVVLEGDYNIIAPSEDQLEALARILAWAAETYAIDPATISGHRDYAATTCPGDAVQAVIEDGSLQERVEELLAAGGVSLTQGTRAATSSLGSRIQELSAVRPDGG